jgi:hypothetical protein
VQPAFAQPLVPVTQVIDPVPTSRSLATTASSAGFVRMPMEIGARIVLLAAVCDQRPRHDIQKAALCPSLGTNQPGSRLRRPHINCPHEPVGIAPFRLSLDDESLTVHGKQIARARACDLARPHLEGRGLGVDAGLAEADNRIGARGGHPHRAQLAAGQGVGRRRCRLRSGAGQTSEPAQVFAV